MSDDGLWNGKLLSFAVSPNAPVMNTPNHLHKFIELLRVVADTIPHSPESETQAALERRRDAFLYIWRRLQGDTCVREFCAEVNAASEYANLPYSREAQALEIARGAKIAARWLPRMLALREQLNLEKLRVEEELLSRKNAPVEYYAPDPSPPPYKPTNVLGRARSHNI